MTTYTELFSGPKSLARRWFNSSVPNAPTTFSTFAPTGARCAIISAVGAGGWKTNSNVPGGGAAFARTKILSVVDNEEFDGQVGCTLFSLDAGTSYADSFVTRVSSSTVVCKAVRGTGTVSNLTLGDGTHIVNGGAPGLATNCIGDIKRDGSYGNSANGNLIGGASAGDDGDTYCLGFGGRGARHGLYPAANWGGGGIHIVVYDTYGHQKRYFPGAGRVCIEFFTKDPGYF